MRLAIIDLGTNSVRFDIHQLGLKRKVQTLYREKLMVRLGQGVFVKGQLDSDAIYRTTHAFSTFKRIAEEFSVNQIVAIGTSALREAVDGQKLISAIKKRTGIEIKIISGTEEARLIALGVLTNEKRPRGKAGLVDIGGGSTEICVFRGLKLLQCESLPLGTARLQQVFLKRSPPTRVDIEEMRTYIQKTVETRLTEKKWPKTKVGIGSSGTVRALGKILKRITGSKFIERKELELLNKKMARMTTTQLLGLPGVESKRVDMILAGSILLEEMMFAMGLKKIIPTEYSLRDGILVEQLEIAYRNFSSGISFHLPDLLDKAKKLGNNVNHIREVLDNGVILFMKLKPLHKLDSNWRIYLEAAIVLRNVGESVSLVGHPEHSSYIIRNSKFSFINEWESELVAELCLHHEDHKMEMKTVSFKRDKKLKQVYPKLFALLCIIDALDADPQTVVKIKSVRLDKKTLKIFLTKGSASDLEMFRVSSRREIIEKVFKRKIELIRN